MTHQAPRSMLHLGRHAYRFRRRIKLSRAWGFLLAKNADQDPYARLGLIERCHVVCDDEKDGVWPTNHFSVYAELRTEAIG